MVGYWPPWLASSMHILLQLLSPSGKNDQAQVLSLCGIGCVCLFFFGGGLRESSEYLRIVNPQGIYVNPDYTFQGWLQLKAGLVQWSELRALELWMQVIQRLTGENWWVFSPARSGPAGQSPPPCCGNWQGGICVTLKGWPHLPTRVKRITNPIQPFCLASVHCFPALTKEW